MSMLSKTKLSPDCAIINLKHHGFFSLSFFSLSVSFELLRYLFSRKIFDDANNMIASTVLSQYNRLSTQYHQMNWPRSTFEILRFDFTLLDDVSKKTCFTYILVSLNIPGVHLLTLYFVYSSN